MLAVVGAHFQVWAFGFISDDFVLLQAVQDGSWQWLSGFPAGSQSYWRPMVLLSFKMTPLYSEAAHHTVNLALHLGCVFWVKAICAQFGYSRSVSLIASLWFGFHWANVADVIWISGRTDLLCAFFFLLALWAFLKFLAKPQLFMALVCLLGYSLALASKESAVMFLPVCAVLFGVQFTQVAKANRVKVLAVFGFGALLTGLYLFLLWRFFYGQGGPPHPANPFGMVHSILKSGFFMAAPASPTRLDDFVSLWFVGAALVLAAAFIGVLGWKKRSEVSLRMPIGLGLCLFLSMLPMLVFLAQSAPRLLYLSLAFTAFLIAWVLEKLGPIHKLAVLAILLFYLLGMFWEYNLWRTNQDLAKACSESFAAQMKGVDASQPFVILGAPSEREGILVFGNDMNQAFFYAVFGKFGRFAHASAVGQVGFEGGVPAIERLNEPDLGRFERKIQEPAAYLYAPGTVIGDEYAYGPGKTRVLETSGGGRVSHFRFEFSDYIFAMKPLVFDFDGKKMFRLR